MSGKILGLDLGSKWVGVAMSNQSQTFCFPQKTVTASDLKRFLQKIIVQENIKLIIYGLPISLDGTLGPQAEEIKNTIIELKLLFKSSEIEWIPFDERFSSRAAQNILVSQNKKIKNNKQEEHSIAAAVILEGYLNSKNRQN